MKSSVFRKTEDLKMPVQTHKKRAQLTTRHGIFRFALCVVSRNPSADFLFIWIAAERGLCPWPGDTHCGDKQPAISICRKNVSLTKKPELPQTHQLRVYLWQLRQFGISFGSVAR